MSEKIYYITRYALAKGILAVPAGICSLSEHSPGRLRIEDYFTSFGLKDWYTDLEAAQGRVMQMREAEIRKLKARIKKLSDVQALIKVTELGAK